MDESICEFFEISFLAEIPHDKLPSKLDVIRNLFYYTRELKDTIANGAILVINNVLPIWNSAGIPTRDKSHCVKKLKSLYDTWRNYQKNRNNPKNAESILLFQTDCENLFDISHANVSAMIDSVRLEFYNNQTKPGRIGTIQNLRTLLQGLEEGKESSQSSCFSSFTPSQSMDSSYVPSQESTDSSSPPAKTPRASIDIFTQKLCIALDRSRVSSRDAVHIIMAILEGANLDPSMYIINKTSIHEKRKIRRQERFNEIKAKFPSQNLSHVIVHWDGKLLPDLTNRTKVDRLPIIISSTGTSKLLDIPKLDNGEGKTQANAIYKALVTWGLSDVVVGLCCDTTASNLGRINGAAVLLEQQLERDILYFPCRHHILEIILRSAFESLIPGTVGPEVSIFARFRNSWANIDTTVYESGLTDSVVELAFQDDIENIIKEIKMNLNLNLDRDDYKELLCLSLLYLGVKPHENYTIKSPGAMHHARWMSKAVYTLKIFLFRNSFTLSKSDLTSLQQISIFIVKIYIKYWFTAEMPEKAPYNDLNLLRECFNFASINKKISQATTGKIVKHLWYLSPEHASMAFFDDRISFDTKRKMISKLNVINDECETKQLLLHISQVPEFCEKGIEEFISNKSSHFFKRFELNLEWMENDPELWTSNHNYQECQEIIKSLKVVNDIAERNIHLFEQHNNVLTKDEEQLQYIMHCLEEYRRLFPTCNKNELMGEF